MTTARAAVPTRERDVRRVVVQFLLALGCRVYSFSDWRAAPTRNTPGVPDLYAFLPQGRGTLWIELKRPGGVLSDEQREFAAACAACGQPLVVGGMAELSATLRDLGVIG